MPNIVPKIDIHVHSCLKKAMPRLHLPQLGDYTTPDELRVKYDEMGIEFGVQLPGVSPECRSHIITNEESYELVQRYPETYDWFCNIDPRWLTNDETADLSKAINYYKEMGAKGIGELTANLYIDDPRYMNLFRHAEKCEMPITIHIGKIGGEYGMVDDLGLPRLEKVLKEFPNLIVLGHSQKFWAEISENCSEENRGGYPTGKVIPGRVVELMRKYPNLHGDLSANSGGNAIMRDKEFGYGFMEEFQDRLYFGTDICDPRNEFPLSEYLDDAVISGKLSQDAYEKISRKNALKLLKR